MITDEHDQQLDFHGPPFKSIRRNTSTPKKNAPPIGGNFPEQAHNSRKKSCRQPSPKLEHFSLNSILAQFIHYLFDGFPLPFAASDLVRKTD